MSKKPVNPQPNPPKHPAQSSTQSSSQPLAKTTGPQGNLVGGDAKAVSQKTPVPKTTPKAKPTTSTAPVASSSTQHPSVPPRQSGVQTDAQTTLEQAKQAVEQFAAVNASQAHALGVQLADAEAAFPLTMMQGYQTRKAELEGSGMDASTFLAGLTEQVTALQETPVTLTLPTADGTALLPGTDPAA